MVKVKVDLAEANYKYNSFNHPMVKVKAVGTLKKIASALFQPPYGES